MAVVDPRLDSGRSWLVCWAAAAGMFATFGVAYSFGAFFQSMSDTFGSGTSATALVFSITISLSFFLGVVTGRWADRVGPRPVMIAAGISLTVGLLLTAAAPSIWVGYLTYGIGVGFAVACAYVPMVAMVGGWFQRRRAAALGVAVAGIGLGTLVGSPVAARLIDATSWRTTYVIFGLTGGSILLLASTVVERGPAAAPFDAPSPLHRLLRHRDFARLYAATLCTTFGLFVPFVFIVAYAEDRGVGEVAAATLVGLIGGASVVGRLGLGGLADRLGSMLLFVGSYVVMAASHGIWLLAGDSFGWLVSYTIILGVGYGGFIALSPVIAAERFGLEGLGGVLGSLYTAAGIGAFVSPPLAGVLIDWSGYRAAIGFAAVMSTLGVLALLPFIIERRTSDLGRG